MRTRICFLLSVVAYSNVELLATEPRKVHVSPIPSAIKVHCFACHDAFSAEAELDLESLVKTPESPSLVGRMLEKIEKAVASDHMPPSDADKQPSAAERKEILNWANQNLDRIAAEFEGDPGHVVMSRLTPYEYRNVLRDLSGGIATTAGQYLPTEGGSGEGFANVGEAQGMSSAQLEKYIEAAKLALRYLRVDPHAGLVWDAIPRDPVDQPDKARQEMVDAIIAWYVGQQQKFGEEHREAFNQRFGFIHAAYLEAAWRYRFRQNDEPLEHFATCEGMKLAPVALSKWWNLLNDPSSDSPLADWAAAWRELPGPDKLTSKKLRAACIAITSGERQVPQREDYAPRYEISVHEAKEEVLEAANQKKYWPFRIDIGNAKELFLVVTDAGDGGNGEYAIWQNGRIVFADGTSKPWQQVVTVVGANSGREFKWGIDGEGAAKFPKDSIGVRPPGALKFAVPAGARVFEVELAIDTNRTKKASIQALVLNEKPKSQSYVPGRYVFGGKKRTVLNNDNKQRRRALRLRNVAEANRTKIGLNAERNVFANWKYTSIEHIGGPWPDQDVDRAQPQAPYHYTVAEVLKNATQEDLQQLRQLEQRLLAIAQPTQQQILSLCKDNHWEPAREGVLPPVTVSDSWSESDRQELKRLSTQLTAEEAAVEGKVKAWLTNFARRAWRRQVSASEADFLLELYQSSRRQGFSFDSSFKASLLVVLASPHFLYKSPPLVTENRKAGVEGYQPLTDYELASRLSFFLWASIPDEELLDLAAKGELSRSKVLKQQTLRMLRDERAISLATDFAGQLWGFANFQNFTGPDEERFPEFTAQLRQAMHQEVVTFLDDLFRNNRSLTRLLDTNETFVNDLLAEHYGINNVQGTAFRRVSVDEHRGGLTGMGLFLTKSSLPLRTSPVQRGVWVLEQLLGDELPNPPALVPQLSKDETNDHGENIQQQLKRHRESASCASCHNKIDPLGISLENYDAIGRWRKTERDGSALATHSVSHDGVDLLGASGLKSYLLTRQDDVFRYFHRKLLGYALGRAVGPGDRTLLNEMQRKSAAENYRFSTLVETIVTSRQFTHRRAFNPANETE